MKGAGTLRNFHGPADQCPCCRISGRCCRLQSPANVRYNPRYAVPRCHTVTTKPPSRGPASLQSGVRLWWWCQMNGQSQLEPAQLRENWGNKSSDLKLAPLASPALGTWARGGVVAALNICWGEYQQRNPASEQRNTLMLMTSGLAASYVRQKLINPLVI